MKNNPKGTTEDLIDPSKKTERIRARFDEIAAKHGLISSEEVVAEVPKQVLDIVIGDEGAISTRDDDGNTEAGTSQIMEVEAVDTIPNVHNNKVLIERNNLQKGKSIITMYSPNGKITTYKYIGKSRNTDDLYTEKKRFLKLEVIAVLGGDDAEIGGDDAEIGRIDVWNGVLSPMNQVRYAKGRPGGYGEKPTIFEKIEFKY